MNLAAAGILAVLGMAAGGDTADVPGPFDPSQVEVLVLGTPHLLHVDTAARPDTDAVLRRLMAYAPDHLAVEWLNPRIDPATTENYRPLADRDSLAAAWGYDLAAVDETLAGVRADLEATRADAAAHVGLGKLTYLAGDPLNAGYLWWLAEDLGADLGDLKTLTRNNYSGHELEIWGFPIAQRQGLLHITPCDYQGEDARWIWFDIVMRVMAHAIHQKHSLQEGDEGFAEAVERYAGMLEAHAGEDDPAFSKEYGDLEAVREFIAVVTAWEDRRKARDPEGETDGLAHLKRVQSAAYAKEKRQMYAEVYPMISLDGLGQQLADNWMLRNARMIDFVEQDARRFGSRRILIIVGEGHKPFLDDELHRRGYKVVSSLEYLP